MQTRRKRNERAQTIILAASKKMENKDFEQFLRIVASAMALGIPKWKSMILLYRMIDALVPDDTPENAAKQQAIVDYIYSGKKPKTQSEEAEHGKA